MVKDKKILVLGSAGQLGKEFVSFLAEQEYKYIAPREDESSIADFEQINRLIGKIKPDILINCAAYNAVDEAEAHPDSAYLVNGQAVESLAAQCKNKGIFLVHFSSDYVFDGRKQFLYTEEDQTNPLNVYGKSKLAGDQAVIKHMTDYLIFRLSWVIGKGTQNFLYKLSGWAEKNPMLKISADEVSVPTFTDDIVKTTLLSLEKNLRGLYHLTNSGYASRYELAKYYIEKKKLGNIVIPVPMSIFKTVAKRPLFSAMSNQKIETELGIKIPTWQDRVDRFCENQISDKELQ